MSATFEERPLGLVEVRCDYALVPAWHQEWIAEHAEKLARQAFLAVASGYADGPQMIDPQSFEAAGVVVVRNVIFALEQIEDAPTIKQAALFGAEAFSRRLFGLLSTSGRGGRA